MNWTDRPGWSCFRAAIVGNNAKFARSFAKLVFCDVTYSQNAELPMVKSNGLNSIFTNKGNCGKKLGHLFITSNGSNLLSETDFEQYLFKLIASEL